MATDTQNQNEIISLSLPELIEALVAGAISSAQMEAEILRREKQKAKGADKTGTSRLSMKVSEDKAQSVYGLQRMPVTLYVQQWERLVGIGPEGLRWQEVPFPALNDKGEVVDIPTKVLVIPVDNLGILPEMWDWQRKNAGELLRKEKVVKAPK